MTYLDVCVIVVIFILVREEVCSMSIKIGLMVTMDVVWVGVVEGVGVSGLYYREERGVMNRARHSPGPVIHSHTYKNK